MNHCKFCNQPIDISHRSYLSNPFCMECYEDRLEKSGAIDLTNNSIIVDLGNGYAEIKPIDTNKKFKRTDTKNF